MNFKQAFIKLTGTSFLIQIVPFLVLPLITRNYSAEDIGRWVFFSTLVSNLSVAACFRYEYALILPKSQKSAVAILHMCIIIAFGWGGFLVFVLLAINLASSRTFDSSLIWLPIAVVLGGFIQSITLWHNRCGNFDAITQARITNTTSSAFIQLIGAKFIPSVHVLCGAQVLGQFIGALLLARKVRGFLLQKKFTRRWLALARRYQQFPLVNTPHAFVNGLQDTVALTLVLTMSGPIAAGFFGLMMRVVMAPTSLIGGALSEVLLSNAARTHREGGDLTPVLQQSTRLLVLIALPLAIVLISGGSWLFATIFGPQWREAGEWARWLAPYVACRMIVGPLTVIPMILERQTTALFFGLSGNAIYILSIWAGLAFDGNLKISCAIVSAAMVLYFSVFWLWIKKSSRIHPQFSKRDK